MVRFYSAKDGKPLIGIGLTKENIQKLKESMPILLSNEDMRKMTGNDINAHLLIMYGDTVEDIAAQLSPLISDKTKINL